MSDRGPEKSKRGNIARHFRGWQSGVLIVGLAMVGAGLAVPHPTDPYVVPVPAIDEGVMREHARTEHERAEAALAEPLSARVRAVGELVRRLGRVQATSSRNRLDSSPTELRSLVRREIQKQHAPELLRLRALQSELFVSAVERFEHGGEVDDELRELGGDFPAVARKSWLDEDGQLVLSRDDLRLLFRVRWGLLTGTHRVHPFGPTLQELRRYYGVLIEYPEGGVTSDGRDRALRQLDYVKALGQVDSSYPTAFAEGVTLFRAGEYVAAEARFQDYLAQHPSGRWALLARNHGLSARQLQFGE